MLPERGSRTAPRSLYIYGMNGLSDNRTSFAVKKRAAQECLPLFLTMTANAAAIIVLVALRPRHAQDAAAVRAAEAMLLRRGGGACWEQQPQL